MNIKQSPPLSQIRNVWMYCPGIKTNLILTEHVKTITADERPANESETVSLIQLLMIKTKNFFLSFNIWSDPVSITTLSYDAIHFVRVQTHTLTCSRGPGLQWQSSAPHCRRLWSSSDTIAVSTNCVTGSTGAGGRCGAWAGELCRALTAHRKSASAGPLIWLRPCWCWSSWRCYRGWRREETGDIKILTNINDIYMNGRAKLLNGSGRFFWTEET